MSIRPQRPPPCTLLIGILINNLKHFVYVITENPTAEEDDYRVEVLIALRKLERLDKDEYTEDERNDAEEMAEARKAEEANMEVRNVLL